MTGGYEVTGAELGAGVSVIVVDAAPGEGPSLHVQESERFDTERLESERG